MKHLKTYESLQDIPDVSYEDFLTIKYWRYAHSMTNNIIRINNIQSKNKTVFHMTILNLDNVPIGLGLFHTNGYDESFIRKIINVTDDKKILRPATEDEIEFFEIQLNIQKYNL